MSRRPSPRVLPTSGDGSARPSLLYRDGTGVASGIPSELVTRLAINDDDVAVADKAGRMVVKIDVPSSDLSGQTTIYALLTPT